jgi:hypothetical protein
MDLANMNVNMMNTKCRVQPCQTVCLQKEPETGCFVCSPTCSSGSNIGIPETNPGMVMPMQPVGSGNVVVIFFIVGCFAPASFHVQLINSKF